jgi:PAS domain S-box-containing protein
MNKFIKNEIASRERERESSFAFGKNQNNPSNMRLSFKLILIFLLISLLPIAGISYIGLGAGERIIRDQILADLTLASELAEGKILIFFERQKVRASDWSTDGHIREETEFIVKSRDQKEKNKRIYALSQYLRAAKQSLDSTAKIIDIFDLEGTIIASTNELRLLHQEPSLEELDKEYAFSRVKNASYGEAVLSELLIESEIDHPKIPLFHLSAPLFTKDLKERVGIMVVHVSGEELNSALSGELQIKLGALSGGLGRRGTLEIYLVNRDGLMITPSRFVLNAVLSQKVDNEPVYACLQKGEEFSGRYRNYQNIQVYGASMCPRNQWWMLLAEVYEAEALLGLYQFRRVLLIFMLFVALAVIFIGSIFGRRLVKRISGNLNVIEEIGRGNFKTRVPIIGQDIIAKVGMGINKMAESLALLTNRQTMLSEVIGNSAESVIITNAGPRGPEHKILYVNQAWEKLFGYTAEEVVNKESPRILKSGKHSPEFYDQLWTTIEAGKFFRAEMIMRRKNGSLINIEQVIMPVKNANDKIVFYAGLGRDITERKIYEQQAKELDQLKGKFITIVSHQLRTPLNAVRWTLEAVLGREMGEMPRGMEEVLKTSYSATKEIISRTNDLVTAMDIAEGRVYLTKEKISLEEILGAVYDEFKARLSASEIEHRVEFPEKPLPLIEADPTRIREIFVKLFDNAVSYTKAKGKINAKIYHVDDIIRFEISDTGIGIPKTEQAHIFTRFHRASNAFTMKPDASGLGLYLAKSFIEAHGGKIGFESEEGKGTTFSISLPIISRS